MTIDERKQVRTKRLPKEGEIWVRLRGQYLGTIFQIKCVTQTNVTAICPLTNHRTRIEPHNFLAGQYGFVPVERHAEFIERTKNKRALIATQVSSYKKVKENQARCRAMKRKEAMRVPAWGGE
jgi:hypothetical protein